MCVFRYKICWNKHTCTLSCHIWTFLLESSKWNINKKERNGRSERKRNKEGEVWEAQKEDGREGGKDEWRRGEMGESTVFLQRDYWTLTFSSLGNEQLIVPSLQHPEHLFPCLWVDLIQADKHCTSLPRLLQTPVRKEVTIVYSPIGPDPLISF